VHAAARGRAVVVATHDPCSGRRGGRPPDSGLSPSAGGDAACVRSRGGHRPGRAEFTPTVGRRRCPRSDPGVSCTHLGVTVAETLIGLCPLHDAHLVVLDPDRLRLVMAHRWATGFWGSWCLGGAEVVGRLSVGLLRHPRTGAGRVSGRHDLPRVPPTSPRTSPRTLRGSARPRSTSSPTSWCRCATSGTTSCDALQIAAVLPPVPRRGLAGGHRPAARSRPGPDDVVPARDRLVRRPAHRRLPAADPFRGCGLLRRPRAQR
jgi:hypothetical protein